MSTAGAAGAVAVLSEGASQYENTRSSSAGAGAGAGPGQSEARRLSMAIYVLKTLSS